MRLYKFWVRVDRVLLNNAEIGVQINFLLLRKQRETLLNYKMK